MSDHLPDEQWMDGVEESTPRRRTPARVKSRVYSNLIRRMRAEGPLEDLAQTRQAGRGLCVFEELVRIAPVGQRPKGWQYCTVCHARILAESIENAPIYWGHCPYVRFQNR